MDVLKKCKKAEIYTLADEAICEAEVFRDMEGELWLSIPGDVNLETAESYTVIFFDSVSGLLRCQCSMGEARPISDERISVPCRIVEIKETTQRRQDLKIYFETNLEMFCSYVPGTAVGIPERFKAVSRDISAGGIYFTCEYRLPEGTVVQFQLHGASKPLLLAARVLRFESVDERDGKPQFGHGCQFIEMRPQTEAVLRNYIFRQERQRRR